MNCNSRPAPAKKFLDDICVIRVILILLLIVYHSMCPYTSAFWANPQGYDIPVFYWAGRLSYSCMLETFVFISGIILGFQVLKKGSGVLSFRHIMVGKVKRLIIPSIIFSILYFLIFVDFAGMSVRSIVMSILEGTGHMWFLPMLFWCFVFMAFLDIVRLNKKWIIPFLVIVSLCSIIILPLRLSLSAYYFLFFFCGFCVGSEQISLSKYFTKKYVCIAGTLFVVLFPVLTYLRYDVPEMAVAEKIGGGYSAEYQDICCVFLP